MAVKTDIDVTIGGKTFTLSGYESEEYLQKIAFYLNSKIAEYNREDGFKRLPLDSQAALIELNIADDYFKAKKQIELLEEDIANREKEMYDLKHELIATQIKLENTERNFKKAQEDLNTSDKQVVKLETELKQSRKNF